MATVASAQPRALGAFAAPARRAALVALLAACVLVPRVGVDVFDFPAVQHAWSLLPFAALMILPFAQLGRRSLRAQIDLLALLSFVPALALTSERHPWSLMLPAAPLLYFAVRMPTAARGCERLRPQLPRAWMLSAVAVLVAVHATWALTPAAPFDVGLDSVKGALHVIAGHALYAGSAASNTYGPANFEAYVPFAAIFSSATAAARVATLAFTLITAVLLLALGRRERGIDVGVALAFVWLAFPFTRYEDALGVNDTLVAATLVATLLALDRPGRRGVAAAVAAWTKLSPLALVPLLAARDRSRGLLVFCAAFTLASALIFVPAFAHDTPAAFLSSSFGYQASRTPSASLWAALANSYALHAPWLGTAARALHGLVLASAVALGLLLPWLRPCRGPAEVAAASAGILALLEMSLSYFSFSYILWFAPLVLVAALLGGGERRAALPSSS